MGHKFLGNHTLPKSNQGEGKNVYRDWCNSAHLGSIEYDKRIRRLLRSMA